MNENVKLYPYRWIVLGAFMLITLTIQIQWLTHAPIARAAEVFYAGQFNPDSVINIDSLAMMYMLVYLAVCIPASYVIDTYGIRVGIGIGSVIAGVCAILKGVFGGSFAAVLAAQIGLAVAQPFILNAVTAVSARWFPLKERGLAAGLAALSQYLGIIVAMGVTPLLVETSPTATNYGSGIKGMLLIYGIITAASALIAVLVIREKPPTPPSSDEIQRHSFTEGFKHIFKQRDMLITLLLFFIGLGLFNAVSSMVDSIAEYLGVEDSDGLIGVFMLIGGVIGAVILPTLSDKFRKRRIFLVICMAGVVPAMAGLTFAADIAGSPQGAYTIALAASFILGFFIMSAGPIGFQYAAEVSAPAPESTSQGLLLLAGQITGLVFVAGMSVRSNAHLPAFMVLFFALSIVSFAAVLFLRKSPMMQES